MPFDAFMELCLYDPDGGFFSAGAVRPGTDADFVTSPEVSPWFGRLIGRWAAEQSRGGPATLLEIGGGSGSLLEPLVHEVGDAFEEIVAVEASGSARRAIADRVPIVRIVDAISDVPSEVRAVVVANEVLDNIPARLVERSSDGWSELRVGESAGGLALQTIDADAGLSAWCDTWLGVVPEGAVLTAQMGVETWLRVLLEHFAATRILIIDYAATTERLVHRRRSDIVRGFARQRTGHDVLASPGATDITVDVNADVVVAVAEALGATVSVTDQRSFLTELGAVDVLDGLAELSHERARAGDVMGQLVARSDATNLRAVCDPVGLGGFSVFRISSGT